MNTLLKYITSICLCLVLAQTGCVFKINNPFVKSPPKKTTKKLKSKQPISHKQIYFIHKVRYEGETLSIIARWYIGNYKSWKSLAHYNPELNPSNIHVGDKVWIPRNKMKTFKRMPKSFLKKYTRQKKEPIIKKHKPPNNKPIELYGPKEHEEETE